MRVWIQIQVELNDLFHMDGYFPELLPVILWNEYEWDVNVNVNLWMGNCKVFFYLIHDDDWIFTSRDPKIAIPTFYTWAIHLSCNTHTCFPIIASNGRREGARSAWFK